MAAGSTVDVKIGKGDAEWLNENEAKRVRMLEKLTGATAKVSAMTSEVTLTYSDDADGGGVAWGEHCVKALLGMNKGETLDVPALPETTASWTPPVKTIKVPKDAAKGFLLGREGARLREMGDELGIVIVFVREMKPIVEKPLVLEVGALVEAKFEGAKGDPWFEAEIKEVGDEKIKVRWTYDDDVPIGEVDKADIRALPVKAEPIDDEPPAKKRKKAEGPERRVHPSDKTGAAFSLAEFKEFAPDLADKMWKEATPAAEEDELELEVGMLAEALFDGKGTRMFELKIIAIDGEDVTVKWTYDDDLPEAKLKQSDIKTKPKLETEKLRIYGFDRPSLVAELKVMQIVEGKVAGFAAQNVKASSDAEEGLGLSIVPLLNNGEFKGRCVGSKGSMRKKIETACGSALEYPGNSAFIIGTKSERDSTAGLLSLVQSNLKGEVTDVPKALDDMCTRIVVPDSKNGAVMGEKRSNMNAVEEETSTLSFWVPSDEPKKEEEKVEPDFTPIVGEIYEGKFVDPKKGDQWFEAKVLEEVKSEGKDTLYKVEWQYDPEEKSEVPASSLRKVGSAPAKPAAVDKTLGIFGTEESRKSAASKVQDLMDGKDLWPKKDWAGGSSWEESEPKKAKVEYVVTDEEEERRKKRAARFA